MARPLRIEYAGALYHVTSRGDRREDIYYDDEDRLIWLDVFSQVCSRFNWRCHAWCLMDNHYHILIETIEANLSQGMRQLNGVYTQRSNRKHNRAGHVFQGRYKAILIQKDSYLLELSRYIVLNPIRANTVSGLDDWPWSSYIAMVGESGVPEWLEIDWILAVFSDNKQAAIAKYINFVRSGIGLPSIWSNLRHQIYLGDDNFIRQVKNKLTDSEKQKLKEINRPQRRALAKPLTWYKKQSSNKRSAMAIAYASGAYSMKEIADEFSVHYSTVSRAVKVFEDS